MLTWKIQNNPAIDTEIDMAFHVPVNINSVNPMNREKNANHTPSFQSLILAPSKGPNGSILNAPRIRFAVIQKNTKS